MKAAISHPHCASSAFSYKLQERGLIDFDDNP